jgi:acyl-CoA synthetase (AMP-forming)/AMP-acid ligase II
MSKFRATHCQAPNFAFKLTANKFQQLSTALQNRSLDLSSVRHVINAAEPVDEESINAFCDTFSKFGFGGPEQAQVIFPTYGLAEHTVFVCTGGTQRINVSKPDLEVEGIVTVVDPLSTDSVGTVTRLVGCGYPSRCGVDVRIVDPDSCEPLDARVGDIATSNNPVRVGEIWINSPSKAAGYYGNPEATKHDFHASLSTTQDAEERATYLRTGDLGFAYNDELFICGRLKDLIIVGGRNYFPQDIESTVWNTSSELLRPGCIAAFTVDTLQTGPEQVVVIAELRAVPSPNDLDRVCSPLALDVWGSVNREHSLGLHEIVFIQSKSIPKTSSGKIARAWCRKAYVGGTLPVVYRKLFKVTEASFDIEADHEPSSYAPSENGSTPITLGMKKLTVTHIRGMSKDEVSMLFAGHSVGVALRNTINLTLVYLCLFSDKEKADH